MTFPYHMNGTLIPTIHILSDSVGLTAQTIARAAAAQFGERNPNIEVFPNIKSFEEIRDFLSEHVRHHEEAFGDNRMVVYYTITSPDIRASLHAYLSEHSNIVAVDLMTDAISAISVVSGKKPHDKAGELHVTDENYFRRIDAMEFTIAHDDGRNPQDLTEADIVLLGVSRSSKTPTSIMISQQGYKVANIPLDLHTDPPAELFDCDPTRVFGLITTPDVLVDIRKRRLGNAIGVAGSYADPEKVYEDLEKARSLMRKIGCIVIHTDNRAVEETAQEILRYYDVAHPQFSRNAGGIND